MVAKPAAVSAAKKKVESLGEPPGAEELAASLGPAKAAWDALVGEVGRAFGPVAGAWKRFSAKYPWTHTLEGGGKKLVYLVPGEGSFAATVVMGEKAVALALERGAGTEVRAAIEGARKYAEGRPVRLEVRKLSEVAAVVGLVRGKLEAIGAAPKVAAPRAGGRRPGGARL